MISKQSVSQATIILGLFAVASGVLGYVRESLVASIFGPSARLDAYLAAFLVPTLIFNILNAILPFIFINLFNRARVEDGETEAWAFAMTVFKWLAVGLLATTLACVVFSGPLLRMVAMGFSAENLALARGFLYILAPTIFFSGLFVYATAILQAYKHFVWPAVLSLALNVFTIAAILVWGRKIGIWSLAWGVMSGFAFQFLVVAGVLWRHRIRERPAQAARAIQRTEWLHFILPVILLFVLDQMNLLLVRNLASFLGEGSISMLYFSNIILQLIQLIVIIPVCKAFYPDATYSAAGGDVQSIRVQFLTTARLFLLVTLPIVFGIVILRTEIIQVLFERGKFVHAYSHTTGELFYLFALALLPVGLENIMLMTFFTLRRVWSLIVINLIGIAVNLAVSILLIHRIGILGLALGNLAFHLVTVGLMAAVFQRRIVRLSARDWLHPLAALLGMSAGMAVVTWGLRAAWAAQILPRLPMPIMLGANVAASGAVFLGLGLAFKNQELLFAVGKLRQVLRGGR